MKIAIGSDHAGFDLKKKLILSFKKNKIEYFDFGCYTEERVDYPEFAVKVARAVAQGKFDRGILICGTGLGVSITANKISGIRAALCCTEYMAEMARKHNDANILALGGRTTVPRKALKILHVFLNTDFEGGRHGARVQKIHSLTKR
jgi:RpiB/LacA/LacB family sugar-phosphate isomerase